jgi:hypothetical protein
MPTPFTPEEDAHLIATYSTHTAREQAAHLERNYESVVQRRARLVAAGRIDPRTRAYMPRWTAQDDQEVIDMVETGKHPREVARKLGRTETAVKIRAKRHLGGMTWLKNAWYAPMSARDVARVFGLSCSKRVVIWVERDWLKARKQGRKQAGTWRVSQDAILDFLACREGWMSWEPEHITDPDIRAEALRLRAEADGHWVRLTQWACRRGYAKSTPDNWIEKGLLSGIKWGVWYVWSADLEAFVPPGELPYQHRNAQRQKEAA